MRSSALSGVGATLGALNRVKNIMKSPRRKVIRRTATIKNVKFLDHTAHRYWGCDKCKTSFREIKSVNGKYKCSKCKEKSGKKMYYRISNITIEQGKERLSAITCFDQNAEKIIGCEASFFTNDLLATEKFEEKVSGRLFNIQLSGKRCEPRYGNFWNLCLDSVNLAESTNGVVHDLFPDSINENSTSPESETGGWSTDAPIPFDEDEANLNLSNKFSKLKVVVNCQRNPDVQTQGPGIYPMTTRPRGWGLIISNIEFPHRKKGDRTRKGGERDEIYVKDLLRGLNFEYQIERDVDSAERLQEVLAAFQTTLNSEEANCCIVVVMSHGADREFELIDGSRVNFWNKIIYQFSAQNCPDMRGKPKLFFVNTCQDFSSNAAEVGRSFIEHDCSDIFVACAALPGNKAYRHFSAGSVFIRTLVSVFMKHACDTELQKMLKLEVLFAFSLQVQRSMPENGVTEGARRQMPIYSPINFDDFYFNISE